MSESILSTMAKDARNRWRPVFDQYLQHMRGRKASAIEFGCNFGYVSEYLLTILLSHPESTAKLVSFPTQYRELTGKATSSDRELHRKLSNRPDFHKVEIIRSSPEHALCDVLSVRPTYDLIMYAYPDLPKLSPADFITLWRMLQPGGYLLLRKPPPGGLLEVYDGLYAVHQYDPVCVFEKLDLAKSTLTPVKEVTPCVEVNTPTLTLHTPRATTTPA